MKLTTTPAIMSLSAVVPVYNEEDNLLPLHRQLTEVLEQLESDYEIVVIDDGSTDGSFAVLTRLLAGGPPPAGDSLAAELRPDRSHGRRTVARPRRGDRDLGWRLAERPEGDPAASR